MVLLFRSSVILFSFQLWIKKVVISILDRSPPSHQDSSAFHRSVWYLNTRIPASHQPLTSLHLRFPRGERETLRERETEGWTSGWPCTAAFFHLHLLQPSKKRGRKRGGSHSCWPPCSCCFNMPRRPQPTSVCRILIALLLYFYFTLWF